MYNKDIEINTEDKEIQLDYISIKRKLKKAREDKKLTQTQLAEIAGVPQGRISTCLNEDNSDFFTFEQMYKICSALGLSMDEITGLKDNQAKSTSYTLSDACSALCDLHRIMPLEVHAIELDSKTSSTNESIKEQRIALISKCKECDSMLKEFSKVSSISSDMITLWKDDFKNKHKDNLRKYGFLSHGQYILKWLNKWISEMQDISTPLHNARKTPSYIYQASDSYDASIIDGESVYSEFERVIDECDLNIMYNNIEKYIKLKNYPNSSVEYISLSIFKTIYQKKHPHQNNDL